MKLRINNATLFVTVLSACLGLVAAGASSHAQRSASYSLSEITSATSAQPVYRRASRQALKRRPVYNSLALPFVSQNEERAAQVLYRNTNPFTSFHQTLVVTHLPRASIEERAA
jgi:hypothetical protein